MQTDNEPVNRSSTSLDIREKQTETTVGYHVIPTGTAGLERRVVTAGVGKDAVTSLRGTGRSVRWHSHSGKQAVSQEAKHRATM